MPVRNTYELCMFSYKYKLCKPVIHFMQQKTQFILFDVFYLLAAQHFCTKLFT